MENEIIQSWTNTIIWTIMMIMGAYAFIAWQHEGYKLKQIYRYLILVVIVTLIIEKTSSYTYGLSLLDVWIPFHICLMIVIVAILKGHSMYTTEKYANTVERFYDIFRTVPCNPKSREKRNKRACGDDSNTVRHFITLCIICSILGLSFLSFIGKQKYEEEVVFKYQQELVIKTINAKAKDLTIDSLSIKLKEQKKVSRNLVRHVITDSVPIEFKIPE